MYKKTRGIRNNNPGNIRRTSDVWVGLAEKQTDPDFFVFSNEVWGIRALAKVLINYQKIHNLATIEKIISRWAPTIENDTESYIKSVSRKMNVGRDTALNLNDIDTLISLVQSIIYHENGIQPYSQKTIEKAISLI